MQSRGLRSLLQPILYLGIAGLVHGLFLLIPLGGTGKVESQTTRGVRVKAFVQTPSPPESAPAPKEPAAAPPQKPPPPPPPNESSPSALGNGIQAAGSASAGNPAMPPGPGGASGGPGGGSGTDGVNTAGPQPTSEYGQYLARLRSDGVQGWAKESSKSMRQGWKGTGSGTGTGSGWGQGPGSGKGSGKGGGGGRGSGGGGGYLDPRVQMVVTSYPPTGIENRFSAIPYPDMKIKKARYVSGWWNVYIKIFTDSNGKIWRMNVLRPESKGELEKIFIEQVRNEVSRWPFDAKQAEIHIDVRFYVE